jgi:hypothetical protein
VAGGARRGFWGYLKHKEIDHFPAGRLRWWLLGLIVLGWAVEQYEALKNGPVLVYILEDFDKSLVEWGYAAAGFGASAADDLAGFRLRHHLDLWRAGAQLLDPGPAHRRRQLHDGGYEPGRARGFSRSYPSDGTGDGLRLGLAGVHDRCAHVDRRRCPDPADLAELAVAILDRRRARRLHGADHPRFLP